MNLSVPTLKGIVRKYNLHVKIVGYSKMKKEDLVKALDQHLEVVDGLVMMKKHAMEHVKKDIPVKEKKVMKKESSKKAKKVMKKESSKKAKKVKKVKAKEVESEHEKHFKIFDSLSKKVNDKFEKLYPYLLTLKLDSTRKGQPKTEGEKLSHYKNIETSDSSKNGIEASIRALEYLNKKLDEFTVQQAFHNIKDKKVSPKPISKKQIDILELKKEVEKSKVVNIKKSKKVDKLFNKINKLSEKIKENNEKIEKQIEKVMEKVPKKQISYIILLKLHKLYLEIKVEKDEDKKQILILELNKLADEIGLKHYNLENWDDVFHKHLGTKKPQENQKDKFINFINKYKELIINNSSKIFNDKELQNAVQELYKLKSLSKIDDEMIEKWCKKYDICYKSSRIGSKSNEYINKRKKEDLEHTKKVFFE